VLITILLLLHIGAAMFGFGPTLVHPLMASLDESSPEVALFAARLARLVDRWLVAVLGGTMLLTGAAMILVAHIDLTRTPYLVIAIALYLILMALQGGFQLPRVQRIIAMNESRIESRARPSEEQLKLSRAMRAVGQLQFGLLLVILFLMVIKPGGITAG
jgi:Predicted integral membrane protein (DUF2269)